MKRPNRSPNSADGATWIALFFLFLLSLGFIGLTALVMPQILGFVFVIVGFVACGILHYVVWGRWLSRYLSEREPTETEED